MKKYLILIFVLISFGIYGQSITRSVGYSSTGLTTAQLNALPTSVKNLEPIIKDTDLGYYVTWNGSAWVALGGGTTSITNGPNTTVTGDGSIGSPYQIGISNAAISSAFLTVNPDTDLDGTDDIIRGINSPISSTFRISNDFGAISVGTNNQIEMGDSPLSISVYGETEADAENHFAQIYVENYDIGSKASSVTVKPNEVRIESEGTTTITANNDLGNPAASFVFDSIYNSDNDVARKANVDAALATAGTDDQDASQVDVDASGFSGNLDTGITNVQLLAQAVDTLTVSGGGSAEYRNPEIHYVTRANGSNVTDSWFETTGQEEKRTVNTSLAVGAPQFYEIATFTSTKSAIVRSVLRGGSPLVFTSDDYNIVGSGTSIVDIDASETDGVIGVYIDSVNVMKIEKAPAALPNDVLVDGYFKPYSISQVTGLASSAITETSYTVSWDAATASVGTISNYQLSIDGGAPITVTGATSCNVTGATAATSYNHNVRSVDEGGNVGQYSADFGVTTSIPNLYNYANAAGPTDDNNASVGLSTGGSGGTWSVITSTPTPTDGIRALLYTHDGPDNTVVTGRINVSNGLTVGDNVTVTVDLMEVAGTNWFVGLKTTGGWSVTDELANSGQTSLTTFSFTATVASLPVYLDIGGSGSSDDGDSVAVDKIIVVKNP